MLAMIALFVLGYEILYSNNHFEKRDVTGTPRLSVQQPTVNGCNPKDADCQSDFSSLLSLPYCGVYVGKDTSVAPSDRLPCIYADRHSLEPFGQSSGALLVPTRITRTLERRVCHPNAKNNFTCDNEYAIQEASNKSYVADVERYTVLVSHSYQRDTISGNSDYVEGSFTECVRKDNTVQKLNEVLLGSGECNGEENSVPIDCLDDSCGFVSTQQSSQKEATSLLNLVAHRQKTRRRTSSEHDFLLHREENVAPASKLTKPSNDVYAIPDGDVFTLDKLLRLAGINLDDRNEDGDLLRDGGAVLHIEARYNNLHPFASSFGVRTIDYNYRITTEPMHQVKDEIITWNAEDFSQRMIENRHGVLIVVSVAGTFGFFSIANLLLMLATAATMLGLATLFTDKLATYMLADRDFYAEKKFDNVFLPESQVKAEEGSNSGLETASASP